MNKNRLFIVIIYFSILMADDIDGFLESEFKGLKAEEFSTLVFRRYYFINRLKEVVDFMKALHEKDFDNNRMSQIPVSLQPLFMVWSDFVRYKHIKDQVFVEDFTKEVFVIAPPEEQEALPMDEKIVSELYHKRTKQVKSTSVLRLKKWVKSLFTPQHDEISYSPIKATDLEAFAKADEIILRFYHIHRMFKSINVMQDLCKKNKLVLPGIMEDRGRSFVCNNMMFNEGHIVAMIRLIALRNNWEPFFSTWRSVMRYRYLNVSFSLMKEFLCFFIIALQESIKEHFSEKYIDLPVDVREKIRAKLHDLPLEELLDILDILVDELPGFIEKYELSSEMEWMHWLRKYWLLAPVAFSALMLRVYLSSVKKVVQ